MVNKEPYDWCCPDCGELECECDPPRPISKQHPHYVTNSVAYAVRMALAKEKS